MTKRALVEPSGRVAQVADKDFPVHPSLVWRDCPDDTTTAHRWNGATFDPPPAPRPPPPPRLDSDGIARALVKKGLLSQSELDAEKT